MNTQSVHIKNFRALRDETSPFDFVTTFLSPNGAGKSTVLRAFDWYFIGKPGSLTEMNRLTFRTATLKAKGLVPEMLRQFLTKAKSK